MPTLIMDGSPKFIICPDCGERYDNARKRRIIDTCGHPRCYSCLFVDNPCPTCEELPKERTRTSSKGKHDSSSESLDKISPNNIKKKSLGSHPDLVELQKSRSSTLPLSFRQDDYFRSLYRYDPHGSSESLGSCGSSSPLTAGRPRSMPPSYHVSIENLNEQFWKSVELAEKKWSPKRKNKETQPKNTKEQTNASRPEVVECPAPDMVYLPVPATTHPKSQLDNHITGREDKKLVPVRAIVSEVERPRSFSDVESIKGCTSEGSDSTDGSTNVFPRPLSWSPTHFQVNNRVPSRSSSSISKSDRYSDSSASINLSDAWSESSDSDSIQSPVDDTGAKSFLNEARGNSNPHHSPPRKYKGNQLANVTYWVVDSGNSLGSNKGFVENKATSHRPKPRVTHQWNGQTNHSIKASLVGVHTNVNKM